MIKLSRLNGDVIFVNPDLVRWMEQTPDTVLTFLDGKTLVVKEKPEHYQNLVVGFRRQAQSFEFTDTELEL